MTWLLNKETGKTWWVEGAHYERLSRLPRYVEVDPPSESRKEENEDDGGHDFESMTTKELREIAKDRGVKGYSRMKQAELIEALKVNEGGGS